METLVETYLDFFMKNFNSESVSGGIVNDGSKTLE